MVAGVHPGARGGNLEPLKGKFLLVASAHVLLVALLLFWSQLFPGLNWGGTHLGDAGPGALEANLVTKVPGAVIPMPSPVQHVTKNRLATDNPGTPSPVHKPAVQEKNSIALPKRHVPKRLARTEAQRMLQQLARADVPPADRRVHAGAGQRASFSYGMKTGQGGGGGMQFGDANFGASHAGFINHLRDRLEFYWLQQPHTPSMPTKVGTYVGFTLTHPGNIENIRLARSSGNADLDGIAVHTVQELAASEKMPLPGDYSPSTLYVQIFFSLQ